MAIWVSRSQPGADRLGQVLSAAGYPVKIAPVFTVEAVVDAAVRAVAVADISDPSAAALPVTTSPPATYDWVVVVSEHAAQFGQHFAQVGANVLAVGPQTAQRLADLGVQAVTPREQRSEGMLQLLADASLAGRNVLIVRGVGGRDWLIRQLLASEAMVWLLEAYERRVVPNVELETADTDVIVVSSGHGFQAVSRVWFDASGDPDVPVLAPSARVAKMAGQLGFTNAHDCRGATPEAVLNGLKALHLGS